MMSVKKISLFTQPRGEITEEGKGPARFLAGSLLLVLALLLAASCASEPKEIPEDLQPLEYFQRAQRAASEQNNFNLAIHYYQTFIERHPDNIQRIVEAKYEIAFLHYKQGKTKQAKSEFEELLEFYEGENANVLPAWPRILTVKVLKKIEENDRVPKGDPSDTDGPDALSPDTDGSIDGGPIENSVE